MTVPCTGLRHHLSKLSFASSDARDQGHSPFIDCLGPRSSISIITRGGLVTYSMQTYWSKRSFAPVTQMLVFDRGYFEDNASKSYLGQ